MPGSWLHLSRRLFGSLAVRDLDGTELALLEDVLSAPEFELFLGQPALDRRHGFQAARYAIDAGAPEAVVRAAALHDVAKRHARLGVAGRVAASFCIKLRFPVRGRFRIYRDHGPIGAAELAVVGAPPIAVTYARCHHGAKPSGFDGDTWALLDAADAAPERSQSVRVHR